MRGEQYLTKTAQYGLVYNKGNAWVNSLLVMKAMPNNLRLTRYGFSISRRVGNAVVRNRTKRLLRENIRLLPLKPGWDIVFIARNRAAGVSFLEMQRSARDLLSRAGVLGK